VAPTVISAARVCLPLGERKPCQVQSKEQNRAERGRLEPRIMGTNWHYKGVDLAKSILRTEGSKCGSPPSWFEGDRFRPLIVQSNHGLKIGSYAPVGHQYESPQGQPLEQRVFDKTQPRTTDDSQMPQA
jgi:hypothetical protein